MRFTSTVREQFEAAHQVEGHTVCGRVHGHAWEIAVTVEGGLDPKTISVVDHGILALALYTIVDEFRDNDLNDMLPGIVTTPEGLALYVRERLILQYPRIDSVEVRMGDWSSVRVESPYR
jgi:6-pyruvoyl-tetrahydropterin synthase